MNILELNHVALHVADLEASIAFYRDQLELEPMARPAFDFPGAWFRLGPKQELHLIAGRQQPVQSHHRRAHFALRVGSIQEAEALLRRNGIAYRPRKRRPDGYGRGAIGAPRAKCRFRVCPVSGRVHIAGFLSCLSIS